MRKPTLRIRHSATFARETGGRLVISGDPKQHGAVQRGRPFKMVIDTGVLACTKLEKIYRQKDV